MPRVTRAERLAQIVALRSGGLTHRQIGAELGLSRSTVRNLFYDPGGTKQKKRRERYRRPCPKCGTLMDGSNGYAKTPRLCLACDLAEREAIPWVHGTSAAYARGCRCRPCRAAVADAARKRYATHKEKHLEYNRSRYTSKKAHAYEAVRKAVLNGELPPPKSCEGCGDGGRLTHNGRRWLHAHHDDYAKPLDVRWLCPPCHKAVHKKMKEAA